MCKIGQQKHKIYELYTHCARTGVISTLPHHAGLDDTGLDTAHRHCANATDLVHVLLQSQQSVSIALQLAMLVSARVHEQENARRSSTLGFRQQQTAVVGRMMT